jgi:hypothetical protein
MEKAPLNERNCLLSNNNIIALYTALTAPNARQTFKSFSQQILNTFLLSSGLA